MNTKIEKIEIGDSVMVGNFSGFVVRLFFAHGELWAKVSNFAETRQTSERAEALEIIS